MNNHDWSITSLAGALSAEVQSVQLTKVGVQEVDAIKALLLEHLVLFFPDQTLTADEHVAFGRHFGHDAEITELTTAKVIA